MTIHSEHPFATPDADRSQVRRFRSRLGGTVALLTSGELGSDAAGLTVSSLLVVEGEPSFIVTALNPDEDLTERLAATGRGVVSLLPAVARGLAEVFAGLAPSPGGPFRAGEFTRTLWGPRLAAAVSWVGVEVAEPMRDLGWSRLAVCRIEQVVVGEQDLLTHTRGRYGTG